MNIEQAKQAVRDLLVAFGLDPTATDFKDTPRRVAEMYAELFQGMNPETAPRLTKFPNDVGTSEVILLRDIVFVSTCSHHLLPFTGVGHIAYVPGGELLGLSKLARILDFWAARPQLQERLTRQVALGLDEVLKPKGVAVVLEASHGCLTCRGAMKGGSSMVTTVLTGVFEEANSRYRDDFFRAIGRQR